MGENPFRMTLLVVSLIQMVISLTYLRKTGAGSTIFGRREEGVGMSAAIAVFYVAYVVAIVVYFLNPAWMAWSIVSIPPWLRWIGIVPLLLGACWSIRSLQFIGNNITISISTKQDHALVTNGPYQWVRHPLYSAGMVESVGVCLLLANWFVAVSAAVFWSLIAYRTPMEERKLIETFGDEYRVYMERVGRFVPRFRTRPE